MDIPRIAPEDVLAAMQRGERIVFVDARSEETWSTATEQIPGSIRVSPHLAKGAGGYAAQAP